MRNPTKLVTGIERHGAAQRGFTLVLALVFLLVLTLLAISGVNSTSLEFTSAGNAQSQSNAFRAAETGITAALQNGIFDPTAAPQLINGVVPNVATDAYAVTVTPLLNGAPQPALWGSSFNAFVTYQFDIASVGSSVAGASATHNRGVAVIAPSFSNFQPTGGLPNSLN